MPRKTTRTAAAWRVYVGKRRRAQCLRYCSTCRADWSQARTVHRLRLREGGAEFDERGGSRTIKNLNLYEVSIAALPANTRARMTRVKDCTNLREAERFLCGLGLTGNEAREFISLCKAERDAKPSDDRAERDAKPWDDGDPERDAKESHRRAAEAFMAEMRQASLTHSMKGII